MILENWTEILLDLTDTICQPHIQVVDCYLVSNTRVFKNQSHSQPQLLAGNRQLQREILKPRTSTIARAGLVVGCCGPWRSSRFFDVLQYNLNLFPSHKVCGSPHITADLEISYTLLYSYLCPETINSIELAQICLYFKSWDVPRTGTFTLHAVTSFS